MSRIDHVFARRQESRRKVRNCQKPVPVYDATTGKTSWVRTGMHRQGDQWWRLHLAELVERRGGGVERPRRPPTGIPITEKELAELQDAARNWKRPEGMTRQVHRALTKQGIKQALRVRQRAG